LYHCRRLTSQAVAVGVVGDVVGDVEGVVGAVAAVASPRLRR